MSRIFASLLLLFVMTANSVFANSAARQDGQPHTTSIFEYLSVKEGAAMTLEFDVTAFLSDKKNTSYAPASLTLADGTKIALEVRARGKYRRRICEVPPLKLKFGKKDLRGMGLDTLNEVRLLLPCSFEPEDEARVLREYLAYRFYEQISPYHVRARLIKITLRDTHIEKSRPAVWALLLEHPEEISKRYDGETEKAFGLTVDSLDINNAALHAVFQYMIGNTDWSIEDARNVYQFHPRNGGKVIPIPFDFDFSGLVDAPYASPTKESGLTSVRERALQAAGIPQEALQSAFQKVADAEGVLLQICTLPQLDATSSSEVKVFMKDFFNAVKAEKMPRKIKAAAK